MTAHTPIVVSGEPDVWHDTARDVNAWRGEAIQLFARAELSVSETLQMLRAGGEGRLRRLVGQRFDDLAAALEKLGKKGAKASNALARFRELEELRPFLCHGVAKTAIDRSGHWIAVLKLVDLRGGVADVLTRVIEERDAETLIQDLGQRTRELTSALQSVRSKLGSSAPVL
ncbi:hypothetical protein H9L14_14070 [Sphingomonas sediminicola]|uniref:Uncharacterized protein n=1 Tax=Sphingomonas sediminicola TaxID=386874 RepID=A0ABX6T702_9SPHN|nr:hypothetical protein [Sphingomonas sediminicola]QNP45632.1 hypothetical protein H9L14_14070 [Sphingomonas sediminicola]